MWQETDVSVKPGLCDTSLPVVVLAVPHQGRTSKLSIQHHRHLAIHRPMDPYLLRCRPHGRGGLRYADPVEELEGHLDGTARVRIHWR